MILGFYSERAEAQTGHSVWTTPSGNHVTVTEACRTPEAVETRPRWPDEVERGEILGLVESNHRSRALLPIRVSVIEPERVNPGAIFRLPEDDDGA